MNTGQIIRSKTTDRFTTIPNELIRSKNLTIDEKGLLGYFLSLPLSWVMYKKNLYSELPDKKGKINRVFKSLQKKGYILSTKQVDELGHFVGWNHVVYDISTEVGKSRCRQIRKSEISDVGETVPINNTYKESNNTYKEEKKEKDPLTPLKEGGLSLRFKSFIDFFNLALNRNYRTDRTAMRHFAARCKDGYTDEDFQRATIAIKNDDFHKNDGYKYTTPELLLRPDKLQRFLNQKQIIKQYGTIN